MREQKHACIVALHESFSCETMHSNPHIIYVGSHSRIRLCACSHALLKRQVHPKWRKQNMHGSYHALHKPKATQWEVQLNCIPYIWLQPASTTHHARIRAIAYSSSSLYECSHACMRGCCIFCHHACIPRNLPCFCNGLLFTHSHLQLSPFGVVVCACLP